MEVEGVVFGLLLVCMKHDVNMTFQLKAFEQKSDQAMNIFEQTVANC